MYPALQPIAPRLQSLAVMSVPPQQVLFHENDPCQGFPLVLQGEVRVSRSSASGRELELYRVQPGELCLVSTASLFAGHALSARGMTTQPSQVALLANADFRAGMADERFRDFVMGLFAVRMADLTGLIDAVAFQRLDTRLAGALLGHGPQVHTTHQALADELGTVREMVTRLLRRFERDGWVTLQRECIAIQNSQALRQLASGEAPHPG
jgi:CRP/FNR family transcriptional regulator, anaerobic regulatory protein